MNESLEPSSGEHPSRTALVLGGGGSTGNAWLIGVVAGLFDAAVDVTDADRIIGTSAGSTAAAQITGATPPKLLADILSAVPNASAGNTRVPAGVSRGRVPTGSAAEHLERTGRIIAASKDAPEMRRRMGAAALELDATSDASRQAQWRATVAARLPSQHWPERTVLITAVDARTGEPVVFDRFSGVDLADAVAASCAGSFAYPIGDSYYIDGGYRTNADNADLASGCVRVLVLSPFGGRSRMPAAWGMHLANQVEELRARGSRVETVFPDGSSEHLFGSNAMDLSMRPAAARAGYEQGKVLAGELAGFWR